MTLSANEDTHAIFQWKYENLIWKGVARNVEWRNIYKGSTEGIRDKYYFIICTRTMAEIYMSSASGIKYIQEGICELALVGSRLGS